MQGAIDARDHVRQRAGEEKARDVRKFLLFDGGN
jgi:hypothetical protein